MHASEHASRPLCLVPSELSACACVYVNLSALLLSHTETSRYIPPPTPYFARPTRVRSHVTVNSRMCVGIWLLPLFYLPSLILSRVFSFFFQFISTRINGLENLGIRDYRSKCNFSSLFSVSQFFCDVTDKLRNTSFGSFLPTEFNPSRIIGWDIISLLFSFLSSFIILRISYR